jgi:hypothetical protein
MTGEQKMNVQPSQPPAGAWPWALLTKHSSLYPSLLYQHCTFTIKHVGTEDNLHV